MAFYFTVRTRNNAILVWPILKLSKSDSSIGGVKLLEATWIKSVCNCHCNVQTLRTAKHMTFVKVVLFDGLDDVNVLLALKYANLVARVDEHEN